MLLKLGRTTNPDDKNEISKKCTWCNQKRQDKERGDKNRPRSKQLKSLHYKEKRGLVTSRTENRSGEIPSKGTSIQTTGKKRYWEIEDEMV